MYSRFNDILVLVIATSFSELFYYFLRELLRILLNILIIYGIF